MAPFWTKIGYADWLVLGGVGEGWIFRKFWAVIRLVRFIVNFDVKSAFLGPGWVWPHFGSKMGKQGRAGGALKGELKTSAR